MWLTAHDNPLATLYTFSSCIATADLNGDNEFQLIIADLGTGAENMKLKVQNLEHARAIFVSIFLSPLLNFMFPKAVYC